MANAVRAGVVVLLLAVVVALPSLLGSAKLGPAVEIADMLALATLWNLLSGYAGIVSIGQQAYVGLGGYVLFALVILAGFPPLLAVPVAGVVSLVVALPVALLLFRLRGPQLAIGSWVVAEVFRLIAAQIGALGGGSGQSLPVAAVRGIAPDRATRQLLIYALAVLLALAATALAWAVLRSRQGLGLTAVRDNETAASSLGVDVRRLKLVVYLAVAGVTGAVGGVIFLQNLRISPDAGFSVIEFTADVIFIVVIGGIGTLEGPAAGTAVFFLFRFLFADYGAFYLIALGAIAIAVMLAAPMGLCGLLAARGIVLLPTGRRAPKVMGSGDESPAGPGQRPGLASSMGAPPPAA
jgi:branched-chain amino acid transport system permease protein